MSLVAQLYGLQPNEAMRLSPQQVGYMLDHAEFLVLSTAVTNQNFRRELQQQLAPTTRAVRREIGSDSGSAAGGDAGGGLSLGDPSDR